eukprot:snap_masked-scaffold_11-processed-gene-0.26-mRNA-1 protein AED:1.00 eAED:1.00 QI:0/0/0/0/1/1/2/0/80
MVRVLKVAGKTKHLGFHYKFAHQEAKRMNAELMYIVRDENITDMFTSAVAKKEFEVMKRRILFAEKKIKREDVDKNYLNY